MTYRCEKLRRAIASLPCACCHRSGPSQAAHSNLGCHGKGLGLKASDAATFPLCPDCHREFDQGKRYTRDERYCLTMEWLAATHIVLIETGLLKTA